FDQIDIDVVEAKRKRDSNPQNAWRDKLELAGRRRLRERIGQARLRYTVQYTHHAGPLVSASDATHRGMKYPLLSRSQVAAVTPDVVGRLASSPSTPFAEEHPRIPRSATLQSMAAASR